MSKYHLICVADPPAFSWKEAIVNDRRYVMRSGPFYLFIYYYLLYYRGARYRVDRRAPDITNGPNGFYFYVINAGSILY